MIVILIYTAGHVPVRIPLPTLPRSLLNRRTCWLAKTAKALIHSSIPRFIRKWIKITIASAMNANHLALMAMATIPLIVTYQINSL